MSGDPEPGDLILLATAGPVYALGRKLTGQTYDHVVVVLDRQRALHISPPVIRTLALDTVLRSSRSPRVIRPRMGPQDTQTWLEQLEQLVGQEYSLAQLFLAMSKLIGKGFLPKFSHGRSSSQVAEAIREVGLRLDFDARNEASGSLEDFLALQRNRPDLFRHVECIEVEAWVGSERDRISSWASTVNVDHVFILRDTREQGSTETGGGLGAKVFDDLFRAFSSLQRFGTLGTLAGLAQTAAGILVSKRDWKTLVMLLRTAQMALLPLIDFDELYDRYAQLAREYPALSTILYAGAILLALGNFKTILKMLWRAIQLAVFRRALLEAWNEVKSSSPAKSRAKL
ncbi:Hypothetical Protein FCC1311_045472 [Hondaea fermentalgiana]|uniref:Uncharacterized protein n=1 Tax=Hondaea fermentalgiana TaxID=2315210 RepID=A0A2R5GKD0_9STRA|nr:Hypothetical Protein FCC1311_045472 [Hondaea fermentalgiana]|eukprot:GBG28324.1 Hypothetical Protein FCC1311_045472 [Hondaea fermentalgiana]